MAVLVTKPGLVPRIRRAIAQAKAAGRSPEFLVLTPEEWKEIADTGQAACAARPTEVTWDDHDSVGQLVGKFEGVAVMRLWPEHHPRGQFAGGQEATPVV